MVGEVAEDNGPPETQYADQPRHGGPVNFGKADVGQVGNQVHTDGVDAVGGEEPQGEEPPENEASHGFSSADPGIARGRNGRRRSLWTRLALRQRAMGT